MENETLKIVPGSEVEVMFLKDEPDVGISSDNRPYKKYTFNVDGTEKVFWSTDTFHERLRGFQIGDKVTIEHKKMKSDKGAYTQYFVHADQDVLLGKSKEEGNGVPQEGTTTRSAMNVDNTPKIASSSPDWDKINADKTADIHKQVCLKLAVQLHGTSKIALDKDETASIEYNMYALLEILDSNNTPF